MSTYMGRELELLVQSMICGALLVLVYDGIRIFRIIGKRVKSLDTAVDILFWSAAGLFLFFMCLRENGEACGVICFAEFCWEQVSGIGESGIFIENLHLFWQKGCIFFYKELQFFYL